MKILHISDTHGRHRQLSNLPDADLIIHSGDFTFAGSEKESDDFINWFCELPYNHKIFISGNHDMCMYDVNVIEGLPDNVHYLCNTGCCIDNIRFWGIPMFMEDVMPSELDAHYKQIPVDINVLITHQPPYGICDYAEYGSVMVHRGSKILAERIHHLPDICAHLFGHEHDCYGISNSTGISYTNAAIVDRNYSENLRFPLLVEI